jgi:CubicO group peptidase (beta-lactamase class C family)
MSKQRDTIIVVLLIILAVGGRTETLYAYSKNLGLVLESIRLKYNLPAIAGAVILNGRILAWDATGFRKKGSDVRVKSDDQFYLASCTKAMTATLAAILVERGQLRWDTTVAEALPELTEKIHPDYRDVTLKQLLAHQAGLPRRHNPPGMSTLDVCRIPGSPTEQRIAYVQMMLKQTPEAPPGEKFIYSNTGYAIAGLMCEQVVGTPWETLMREMLFEPLGMKTAGLSTTASPDEIVQPWQHRIKDSKISYIEPGPLSNGPPARAPAGGVHCSIKDWAKFVAAHLEAGRGEVSLLRPKTFQLLHTPAFGGSYALGWRVTERKWASGQCLTHSGSNGSVAVVWMAPKLDFAVLLAINQSGKIAGRAREEAVGALIQKFLLDAKSRRKQR